MTKLKWVRFWMSDWRSGTASMYAVEYTLYHRICQEIWETGQGVHDDDIERLMLEPPVQVRGALAVLLRLGKLRLEDDRYINSRAVESHEIGMREYGGRLQAAAAAESGRMPKPRQRPPGNRLSAPRTIRSPGPWISIFSRPSTPGATVPSVGRKPCGMQRHRSRTATRSST